MLPFSAFKAEQKTDRAGNPVDNHGNPDAKYTHSKILSQNIAENNPENPHGNHRNNHTHPCISCCPEYSRCCKCQRPDQYTAYCIESDNLCRCGCRKLRQMIRFKIHGSTNRIIVLVTIMLKYVMIISFFV